MTYTGKIQVLRDITEEILDEHLDDSDMGKHISKEVRLDTTPDDDFEALEPLQETPSKGFDLSEWRKRIINATRENFKGDLITGLQKQDIADIDRPIVLKALQSRYKDLFEATLPLSDAKRMIAPRVKIKKIDDAPSWCNRWLWVSGQDKFINKKSLEVCSKETFNIINGKHVPQSDSGAKPNASKFIADSGYMEVVSQLAYIPTMRQLVFKMDGKKYINTFDHNKLPVPDKEYTKEGKEAIARVKRHIRILCGNDRDANIFEQWLAHNVQNMGEKILWCPLFQSFEGMGKSFFGNLLEACLGSDNVGTVVSDQVNSSYNGWATGKCVNVLQELKVQGQNRHEVANALKPLITDRTIQVCDKYLRAYNTRNVTNYIAFTNYRDAVPISETDRRWWVIFSPVRSMEDLSAKIEEENTDIYFQLLFETLDKYAGQIHKWLYEHVVSEEFKALRQAPMTESKRAMISTEKQAIEGLEESEALLAEGGDFWSDDVIAISEFFNKLHEIHENLYLKQYQKIQVLKSMGFWSYGKTVKVDGKNRRFWIRRELTSQEIRDQIQTEFPDL